MPVPKGKRFGGRQKGTPNKVTVARAAAIEAREQASGRAMCVARIKEIADRFFSLGNAYSPLRKRLTAKDKDGGIIYVTEEGKPDPFPPNEELSVVYYDKAAKWYAEAAPFESPKLQNTTLRGDATNAEPINIKVKFV